MKRSFLSLAITPLITLSFLATSASADSPASENAIADAATSSAAVSLTCPSSPNCVSSFAQGEHKIKPLSFPGKDAATIREILLAWIKQNPRAHVTYSGPDIIKAEFKSRVFGFVDDLTLLIQPDGFVDIRSASRTGYYDFGVNRERVEKIRSEAKEQ